jgi:hypothetical protein
LVADLKRPERFYFIFTKGNRQSWLFLGSLALAAFGAIATVWLAVGILAQNDVGWAGDAWKAIAVISIPIAVMAAGYTAFLFAQAEGRDLWQSKLLFPHLIAQAVMVGAGAFSILLGLFGPDAGGSLASFEPPVGAYGPDVFAVSTGESVADQSQPLAMVMVCLVVGTVLHVAFAVVEFYGFHISKQATAASRLATRGPYRTPFRASLVLALAAAVVGAFAWNGEHRGLALVSGLAVQAALLMYESVFVRAGQDVPLS